MTNNEVITKADLRSDHRLVRVTVRMKERLTRLKTMKIKKKKTFNINTQKLKGMKERFEINLKKNRFEKLDEEVTTSDFSEIVKEEETKLAGKTKKTPHLYCQQKIKKLNNWKIEGKK